MTRRLILDSGAFSVWSQGEVVDLRSYTDFCIAYPGLSYYVNLDVIPGRPNEKRSLTPTAVEAACRQGWLNYRAMIKELPKDKVVPVYHQNDDIRWLHTYLDFGVKYIGISPANDSHTGLKLKWLRSLKKVLFDGAGRPVVKTHGFAVTSWDLMKAYDWWSVDSATWQFAAAMGEVFLPLKTRGEYDYAKQPLRIGVSPMSSTVQLKQKHWMSMSPLVKAEVDGYLASEGFTMGTWTLKTVTADYKFKRGAGEFWYDRKKNQILVAGEPGVCNSPLLRRAVNAKFIMKANRVLPVKYIYFAGTPVDPSLEYRLGSRMLSYFHIGTSGRSKCLDQHVTSMQERNSANQP